MTGTAEQPTQVSTAETPPDNELSIVTDETKTTASDAPAAADDSDKSAQTSDSPAESDTDGKKKPRRSRSASRKIARLTKKLDRTNQRVDKLLERAEQLEAENEELRQVQAKANAKPKPDIKDFDSPEEYAEAFGQWKAEQAPAKPKPKPEADPKPRRTAEPPPAADNRPTATDDELVAFHDRGKEKLGDDFLDASQDPSPDLSINQAMGDYMLESDLGPELYVYLNEHPELSQKIAAKSETAALKQLKALEGRIDKAGTWELEDESSEQTPDEDETPPGDQGKGKKRRASKAPDPIPDEDTGNVQPGADLDDMDMDDFADSYRKRLAKRAPDLLG